jgi:hypothetical protein
MVPDVNQTAVIAFTSRMRTITLAILDTPAQAYRIICSAGEPSRRSPRWQNAALRAAITEPAAIAQYRGLWVAITKPRGTARPTTGT